MEHKQINSKNGKVHYWIQRHKTSTAKCIVFTHGLTGNHSMFEKQNAYLSSAYTILTWDMPLHGLSRPYADFSYRQSAADLKTILEKEQMNQVVLVGMSLGGYVSQMFAELYPEMAEGFIALDTTPFGLRYYSKSDLWILKQIETIAGWFPKDTLKKSIARSISKTRYSYDKMMEMLEPLTKEEIMEQMGVAYGQFPVENKDMNFTLPVLILLGDSDKTGKVRQYCIAWSAYTGYPLHLIHNAAHFSNGDNSKQVNREIAAFMRGLPETKNAEETISAR